MSRTCTSDVFFVMIARMALLYQSVLAQRRDINPNKSPIHQATCNRVWKRPMTTVHSEGCTVIITGQTEGEAVDWKSLNQTHERESSVPDPDIRVKGKDKLALRFIVPGYTSTDTNSGTRLMSHNGFIEYLQAKEIRLKVFSYDQLIKSQTMAEFQHEGIMQTGAPMKHSSVFTKTNRPQERVADPGEYGNKEKGVIRGAKNRISGAFVSSISRCTAEEDRGWTNGTSFRRCCITDAGFTHYRRAEKENGVIGHSVDQHEEVE